MRVFVDRDHNAVEFTQQLIPKLDKSINIVCLESSLDTPYPLIAKKLAERVVKNEKSLGILICKTGIGMAIVANKTKGAYACNCKSVEDAFQFRRYNMGNILCLGAEKITIEEAVAICEEFFNTYFDNNKNDRIELIREIEKMM